MLEPPLTPQAEKIANIKIPWVVHVNVLFSLIALPLIGALWIVGIIPIAVFVGWVALSVILVMPVYRAVLNALPVLPAPVPDEARLRNIVNPDIVGQTAQGGVLVCNPGQWEGAQFYSFQWQISTPEGFVDLKNANSYWLYLPKDFLGGMIRCRVAVRQNARPTLTMPVGPVRETEKEVMRGPLAADRLEAIASSVVPVRALLRIFVTTLIIVIGHTLVHHFDLFGLG